MKTNHLIKRNASVLPLLLAVATWTGADIAPAAAPGTVIVWGSGQATIVPPGLTNVTAIAAGPGHAVALKSDGSVVAWGYNYSGQTNVPPDLKNVIAIAAGEDHTMALRSDGTVVAWGQYGWSRGRTLPPAGLSGVTAISAGFSHSAALKSDGTVVSWDDRGPATLFAGLSNIVAISVGFSAAALKRDGTVWGWGGQSAENKNVAAVSVSCGGHTLALKSDGKVVAWGYNDYGQSDVPPDLSDVTAISAQGACPYDCAGASVALKSDGSVVAWGVSPDVPPGLSNVTAIAAGLGFTVALVGHPPPPPTLDVRVIGNELILSWPTNEAGFTLQSTLDLIPPPNWMDITEAPALLDARWTFTNTVSGRAQFFRLKKP